MAAQRFVHLVLLSNATRSSAITEDCVTLYVSNIVRWHSGTTDRAPASELTYYPV